MSIPFATIFGQRWHSKSGMQPEPVPRSSKEIRRLADQSEEQRYSASRMTHSSVSGRGMSTGGRTRMLSSAPKGWVPYSKLRTDLTTSEKNTYDILKRLTIDTTLDQVLERTVRVQSSPFQPSKFVQRQAHESRAVDATSGNPDL